MHHRNVSTARGRAPWLRRSLAGLMLLLALLLVTACSGTPTATPAPAGPTATAAPEPTAPPPAPTLTPARPTATPPRPTATATPRPTTAPTRAVTPTRAGAVSTEVPITLSPPTFARVGLEGQSVRALAITGKDTKEGKDNQTIFAGGKGVSRSLDGGDSWSVVRTEADAPFVTTIAIADSNPLIVYVGVSEGCAKGAPHAGSVSLDGGETWKKTLNNIASVAIDPKDPQKVYVATCTGVMHTDDGGTNWTEVKDAQEPGCTPTMIVPAPSNRGIIYVASVSEGGTTKIRRTTNAGVNWLDVSPAAKVVGPLALAIDPNRPETILLSTTVGIFRSTNAGQAWVQLAEGLEQTIPTRPPVGSPDGFRINTALLIDPAQANIFWIGTGTTKSKGIGLLRTRDGGATWKRVSGGLDGRPIQALLLGGTVKAPILFAATDDGIWALESPQ